MLLRRDDSRPPESTALDCSRELPHTAFPISLHGVGNKMQSRPKVVHVVVAGDIGGAEHFLVNLAGRPDLSGADHSVALMTPNPKLREFFQGAGLHLRDRGKVGENPAAYLWRSFGPVDIKWLTQVLREEQADLLHAHTFGSHILAVRAGLRNGLSVVRTEHGVRHYRDPTCALFRHWALRHTDRIVAVSGFVAQTVGAVAPYARKSIRVVWNGVDLSHFQDSVPPAADPFTIASIARLDPVKRIGLAIEAVARVPNVRLAIAGEGVERAKLEDLTRRLNLASRVRFWGHLQDTRPLIAASHAVINCTREEGLGLAIIEAAAMERPAIAFAGGGIPEIVQDRRTGWLVQEEGSLVAAVAEAAADSARAAEFGRAARTWITSKFGIENMCKGYAAVYNELTRANSEAAVT